MAGRKLMQAVCFDGYGGGAAKLKHVEVPVPTPKKDEVLLKLEAASVNPIDWRIQKGVIPILPRKFPSIPVTDIAGEVIEIGPGVKKFVAGDKVLAVLSLFLWLPQIRQRLKHKKYFQFATDIPPQKRKKPVGSSQSIKKGGGLAEYVVAPESLTVKRPPEVSAAEGTGLPLAGLTALQALTKSAGIKLDGSSEKQTNVLITAASGGVGHYAVQLAKLGNVHVTATCGERNIDLVKSLGADEVLDYKTSDGAALKSPSGLKYDAVIHCATGVPWSTFEPNLSEKGKVIDLTPGPSALMIFALRKLTFCKKQLVPLFTDAKAENMEYLVGLVKEGKLKTVVDSKHPLSKAEDAWAKSIDGHATGKIIVEP